MASFTRPLYPRLIGFCSQLNRFSTNTLAFIPSTGAISFYLAVHSSVGLVYSTSPLVHATRGFPCLLARNRADVHTTTFKFFSSLTLRKLYFNFYIEFSVQNSYRVPKGLIKINSHWDAGWYRRNYKTKEKIKEVPMFQSRTVLWSTYRTPTHANTSAHSPRLLFLTYTWSSTAESTTIQAPSYINTKGIHEYTKRGDGRRKNKPGTVMLHYDGTPSLQVTNEVTVASYVVQVPIVPNEK